MFGRSSHMGSSTAGTATSSRFRSWRLALGLLVLVVVLYIGAMIWTHQINDDLISSPPLISKSAAAATPSTWRWP